MYRPGYIAGVTNPLFEEQPSRWDVLCNIVTGKITVSGDIRPPSPTGTTALSETSFYDADIGRAPQGQNHGQLGNRLEARADSPDNAFMDEIISAIASHFGEAVIRARFTDYLFRFIRLASRYEEEAFASTSIGYPSVSYSAANGGRLGSGAVFSDDASRMREMAANVGRIEGWRLTRSYQLWRQVSPSSVSVVSLKS
jgi:Stabilization of polarity axis